MCRSGFLVLGSAFVFTFGVRFGSWFRIRFAVGTWKMKMERNMELRPNVEHGTERSNVGTRTQNSEPGTENDWIT